MFISLLNYGLSSSNFFSLGGFLQLLFLNYGHLWMFLMLKYKLSFKIFWTIVSMVVCECAIRPDLKSYRTFPHSRIAGAALCKFGCGCERRRLWNNTKLHCLTSKNWNCTIVWNPNEIPSSLNGFRCHISIEGLCPDHNIYHLFGNIECVYMSIPNILVINGFLKKPDKI